MGNVDKIKAQPEKCVATKNRFQTLATISESEEAIEPPPGLSTEKKVEQSILMDKAWPKLDESKPSTIRRQPLQAAPKVNRVKDRRDWKPID